MGKRVIAEVNVYAADGDKGIPLRPPPGFIRQMTAYDRELVVGYNAGAGWKAPYGRWIIGRNRPAGDGVGLVMTVQKPDGTFLPLGFHVLQDLRRIDSWRVGRPQQIVQIEAIFEEEARMKNRDIHDTMSPLFEKSAWAAKKDVAQFNFSHISVAETIAEERRIEEGASLLADQR